MSKKHKQQVKHTKVPDGVKTPEERSGKSTLWALLVVIAGLTGSGILVQQTLAQEETVTPETEPSGENVTKFSMDELQGGVPSGATSKDGMFEADEAEVPEEAASVADALEKIAQSAPSTFRVEYLSTNVQARVESLPYNREKMTKAKSGKLLELFDDLLPSDLGFCYDENPPKSDVNRKSIIYVGTTEEVDRKTVAFDVDRLASNHKRISFESPDNNTMTLYDAVLKIRQDSDANILVSYMEPEDCVTAPTRSMSDDSELGQISVVSNKCRHVSYSTNGHKYEWRTVLSSVIEPDYTFDEKDGKVRVMLKSKMESLEAAERNSRPMEVRYVRVYYANPEEIVEKIALMNLTKNDGAMIQVAPYQEVVDAGDLGPVSKSYRHTMSSTSTTLTTGGSTIGEDTSNTSSSWGSLLRPKNPPAILVYDNVDNLDKLEAVIRKMDVREKQVLIEALILDLSDTGSKNLGMKLDEMGFGNIPLLGVSWQKDHDAVSGRMSYKNSELMETSASQSIYANGDGVFKGATGFSRGGESDKDYDRDYKFGDYTVSRTSENELTGGGRTRGRYSSRVGQRDEMRDSARISERTRQFSTVLGPLDFSFVLEMIEEKLNGKLLSSPVLTIGDHSEAMIHVGNVTPILQVDTEITSSTTSIVTEDVEWEELVTGILMWVGPEVTEDGKSVRLWVHPKISEITGEWEFYKETRYPHLTSQEMDTRVTVPSGSTLMMGGLTRTEESEELKKVPVLGDIPFLGRLFRHTSKSSNRRNLVILIRPTILDFENPETGFETPTMAIVDPMMSESGRNLKDVNMGVDKMREREKKIVMAVEESVKDFATKSDSDVEAVPESEEAVAEDAAEASSTPETENK